MDYNYNPEVPVGPSQEEIEKRQNAISNLNSRLTGQIARVVTDNTAFALLMFDPRFNDVRSISCDGPVDPMIAHLRHFADKLEANKDDIERQRLEDLAKAEIWAAQQEAQISTKQ